MLTGMFLIALICALGSGISFFGADVDHVTKRDKLAAGLLSVSAMLLVVIAYIAGAR